METDLEMGQNQELWDLFGLLPWLDDQSPDYCPIVVSPI